MLLLLAILFTTYFGCDYYGVEGWFKASVMINALLLTACWRGFRHNIRLLGALFNAQKRFETALAHIRDVRLRQKLREGKI